MNTPVAIVVGVIGAAVILGAAVLLAFRYDVISARSGFPAVLDRWTGNVTVCQFPQATKADPFAGLLPENRGVTLHCKP